MEKLRGATRGGSEDTGRDVGSVALGAIAEQNGPDGEEKVCLVGPTSGHDGHVSDEHRR